ncbi:MAG TPA: O-acetyl-ADP-ribose deacetylase [Flavobacteriales bacterium]|nr:O-acetyl-ADP-ribose deacetylase [Flavobacteriales bacterium]HRP80681.1 O-acetyl-ADP-ribose deacetylase [Flavobacteriales bacterium]HRQ84887.1 O-acetyl-ADP-ribose deacetylase [Flavobacteriales bacterium]
MRFTALQGDITTIAAEAIVNAANNSLMGGGGVDGAIHRAGGPQIMEDCRAVVARQGGCATGEAVITRAGKLSAKYVIHTVGPVWRGGRRSEPELLASRYRNSLLLAGERGLSSIVFPGISTGVYGFPKDLAAEIAVRTVRDVAASLITLQQVMFVCFDAESLAHYRRFLT